MLPSHISPICRLEGCKIQICFYNVFSTKNKSKIILHEISKTKSITIYKSSRPPLPRSNRQVSAVPNGTCKPCGTGRLGWPKRLRKASTGVSQRPPSRLMGVMPWLGDGGFETEMAYGIYIC